MRCSRHPGQRLRLGPVAPQPDLQEAVAAGRTRLDQPAHRRAVPVQRTELAVAGVGVGIEVDDRDPPPSHVMGHARDVGQGDGVIAAQNDRQRAAPGHLRDGGLQPLQGPVGLAREHLDVAHVDHPQLTQRIDVERQVRPAAVMGQVVGHANRLRPKATAGPV